MPAGLTAAPGKHPGGEGRPVLALRVVPLRRAAEDERSQHAAGEAYQVGKRPWWLQMLLSWHLSAGDSRQV